jgi:hypothetical protein
VANDPFSSFGEGMARGAQFALQAEQVKNQREQLDQQKMQFELQKGQHVFSGLQRLVTMPEKARKYGIEKLKKEAQLLEVPLDDEAISLVLSPENVDSAQYAMSQLLGMPDSPDKAKKIAAGLGMMAGDNESLLNMLASVGKSRADAAGRANEVGLKYQEMFQKRQEHVLQDKTLQNNNEILRVSNQIHGLSGDENAFADAATQTLFSKLLDPTSAVMQGERELVDSLNTGFSDRAKKYITGHLEGTKLTPDDRKALMSAVRRIATESDMSMQRFLDKEKTFSVNQFGLDAKAFDQAYAPRVNRFVESDAVRMDLAKNLAAQYGLTPEQVLAAVKSPTGGTLPSVDKAVAESGKADAKGKVAGDKGGEDADGDGDHDEDDVKARQTYNDRVTAPFRALKKVLTFGRDDKEEGSRSVAKEEE